MTEQGLTEDERRHISEALTDLAKQAVEKLGLRFEVHVEANYKAIPCWLRIQVKPHAAPEPEGLENEAKKAW